MSAKIKFLNNYSAQLVRDVSPTDTQLFVTDVSRLPALPLPDGERFYVTIDNALSVNDYPEIVLVTGVNFTSRALTVERSQDGTGAFRWRAGDHVQGRNINEILDEFIQRSRDYMVGPLVFGGSLHPVVPHIRIEGKNIDAVGPTAGMRFMLREDADYNHVPALIHYEGQLNTTVFQDYNVAATRVTLGDVSNSGDGLLAVADSEIISVNEVTTLTELGDATNTVVTDVPDPTQTEVFTYAVPFGERHGTMKLEIDGVSPNPVMCTVELMISGVVKYTSAYSVEDLVTINKTINTGPWYADDVVSLNIVNGTGMTVTRAKVTFFRNRLDADNIFYDNSNTTDELGDSVQEAIDAFYGGLSSFEHIHAVYPVTAGQVTFPMVYPNVEKINVHLNGAFLAENVSFIYDEVAQVMTMIYGELRADDTLVITHFVRTSGMNPAHMGTTSLWHTFTGDAADKQSLRDIMNAVKVRLDALDGGDL
jgi:hypothetical protein